MPGYFVGIFPISSIQEIKPPKNVALNPGNVQDTGVGWNKMKGSRYTDTQIINILIDAEKGLSVAKLCDKFSIYETTFHNWRAKYGEFEDYLLVRVKELEMENQRLKKLYAEERLKVEIVQNAHADKW